MLDQPLILNLVPTGAVADAAKNLNVPITGQRTIEDVVACVRLGVSIAHLHVRKLRLALANLRRATEVVALTLLDLLGDG